MRLSLACTGGGVYSKAARHNCRYLILQGYTEYACEFNPRRLTHSEGENVAGINMFLLYNHLCMKFDLFDSEDRGNFVHRSFLNRHPLRLLPLVLYSTSTSLIHLEGSLEEF